MQWNYEELPQEVVAGLSSELDVSPYLARLLVRIGITEAEVATKFLSPSLKDLDDPFELTNMEPAVERLIQAIQGGESVLILGDYDVDGVTSTTLLVSVLKQFGLKARYVIPLRSEEGYGLTHSILDRCLKEGKPDLFVALDCGTNSTEEVAFLRKEGVDVIIVDHHQSKDGVPGDAMLINPHVNDTQDAPWKNMCTVGLVFKLFHGLVKALRERENSVALKLTVKDCLDIVAMGTVADMVPLVEENRIVTKYGLERIRMNKRPGLHALCKVSGLMKGQEVRPADISFKLGPRINASGRLADATLPVDMLLGNDVNRCGEIAGRLDSINRERQDVERKVMEEAQEMVDSQGLSEMLAIVLYGEDWHSGVVGIVAGKLSRVYHRPCIVLGNDGELVKGSGRSVPGVDLVKALQECQEYLVKWGGHPMAAGVGLKAENLEVFRKKFAEVVAVQTNNKLPEPCLEIAEWLPVEALQVSLLDELDMMHPFGMGNPEPIFGLKGVVLERDPEVFSNDHFRFQLAIPGAPNIGGIAWKMADNMPSSGSPVDMAIRFGWNNWNGRKSPQVTLLEWQATE